jgi:hypothetical protein
MYLAFYVLMALRRSIGFSVLVTILLVAFVLSVCVLPCVASGDASPSATPTPQAQSIKPGAPGRLYIFREVTSFGADIDDYVTVNGVKVQRITPGTGFYCDVSPGVYLVGVYRHKGRILKVSVSSGQRIYILVKLHLLGGVAPRAGTLTPDQSFDDERLNPGFGARRVQEYRLTRANCQP